jgi:hypothetical protein
MPGTKIARDEILFPARAFCSNGSEKSRKLCIAHLLTIDGKFRDADLVHRLRILRVVSGFPLQLPGTDSDHIGKLSVGRTSEVQRLRKNTHSCRAAPQRRTRAIVLMVKIFPVSYGMNRDCANPGGRKLISRSRQEDLSAENRRVDGLVSRFRQAPESKQ